MKKICLMIGATAVMLLLTACSKDDSEQVANGRRIVFECSNQWNEQQTRTIGQNSYCSDISISATYYTDSWNNTYTPNFMHCMQADLNSNGNAYAFHDGQVWFWPNSGKLRFFAYGPYDAVVAGLSDANATGAPTLNYTCPTPLSGQYDIQYAESAEYICATSSNVNLPFSHLLSAIAVTMAPESGTIESISLQGMATTGTYSPANGWGDYENYTAAYSWNNLSNGNGVFCAVLPQQLAQASAPKLVVNFKRGENNQVLTYDLKANNVVWQPGKLYHYSIQIDGGTYIPSGPEPTTEIIVGIADWEVGGAYIIPEYDADGNLIGQGEGNNLITVPAVYEPGDDADIGHINFVYTEKDMNITGVVSSGNTTTGNSSNADDEHNIHDFDDAGGHEGNGKNENGTDDPNKPTSDITDYGNDTNEDDGNKDGTNDNPETGDQTGHSGTSITNQDDSGNNTNGNAGNVDDETTIHDFDDSGGHEGNGKNEDGTDNPNQPTSDITDYGDDTNEDDGNEDGTNNHPETGDQTGHSDTSITGQSDSGYNTNGNAGNADDETTIHDFDDSGGHEGNGKNEDMPDESNNPEGLTSDYTTGDDTDEHPDDSNQSGYNDTSITPQEDSENTTEGNSSNGDGDNNIKDFDDAGNTDGYAHAE